MADLVIALDDGSTDATAEILEASPLVETVLRNPPRASYAGWDDAANRQRLLDAAVEAGVDWALFLDADERIDADDGAALRRFVDAGARPRRTPTASASSGWSATRATTTAPSCGSTGSSPSATGPSCRASACTSCPSRWRSTATSG